MQGTSPEAAGSPARPLGGGEGETSLRLKLLCHCPPGRGRAHSGDPGPAPRSPLGSAGVPASVPGALPRAGWGWGGSCANRAARKTKLGRHVNMYAVTEVRELMWREGRPVADPGPRPVGAVVP